MALSSDTAALKMCIDGADACMPARTPPRGTGMAAEGNYGVEVDNYLSGGECGFERGIRHAKSPSTKFLSGTSI